MSRRTTLVLGAAATLSACASSNAPPPNPGMSASVTYLHLLAKTPFYRALSQEQLQWVIDHSREWSVVPGAEIASSQRGAQSFWVLLDGGWQVEAGSASAQAGHADALKWYGGKDMLALGGQTRLVATARSYVMQIQQAELDAMLDRGFAFDAHLAQGLKAYGALLAGQAG